MIALFTSLPTLWSSFWTLRCGLLKGDWFNVSRYKDNKATAEAVWAKFVEKRAKKKAARQAERDAAGHSRSRWLPRYDWSIASARHDEENIIIQK
jgi:hypothetical protein